MRPTRAIKNRNTPQAMTPPTTLRLATTAAANEYAPTAIKIIETI